MQKRLLWLALALIAVAIVGLTLTRKGHGKVTVQAIGQTNISDQIHRVILVSNGTDRVHLFTAWAEWPTNGSWKRVGFEDYAWFDLDPYKSDVHFLRAPGNATRIAIACFPKGSQLAYYVDSVKTKLGMKSKYDSYKIYLELK